MTPTTLRHWRESHNLTRREAAAILGLNERTLEGLELGRYGASPFWGMLGKLVPLLEFRGAMKASYPDLTRSVDQVAHQENTRDTEIVVDSATLGT